MLRIGLFSRRDLVQDKILSVTGRMEQGGHKMAEACVDKQADGWI